MKEINKDINKITYTVLTVIVLLLVAFVYLKKNGLVTFQSGSMKTPINIESNKYNGAINNMPVGKTIPSYDKKYASSHFMCDGGKIIDGTFIFEGVARVELKLTSGNVVRSLILPQDLTKNTPIFRSLDNKIVLLNKSNGSVYLTENGSTTFSNCKPH